MVIFNGGLGSGKTTTIAAVLLKLAKYRGAVGGIFAPNLNVLRKATVPRLQRTLAEMGVMPERDYVVGKFPPPNWRVPKFTALNQSKIMTFRNGSYVILDGLREPDSQRGIEFDFIMIDEFRDVSQEALEILEGRLRGECFSKWGLVHRVYLFTTPPLVVDHILKLAERPTTELITAPSWTNPNLRKGYLEQLKATYPEIIYRREVGAELISITSQLFAFEFDEKKHVGDVPEFLPDEPVYLSFDFNISPATCTAWRVVTHGEGRRLQCVREFRLTDVSVYALCDAIKIRYPHHLFIVTGDAAGFSRQGATQDLRSFFDIIMKELGINQNMLKVTKTNPTHRSSWVLCNSILSTMNVKIDKSCKHLIRDLKTVSFDPVKGIDKSNKELGHLLDTFRYVCHTFFYNYTKTQ
jgi:hypothetical protein